MHPLHTLAVFIEGHFPSFLRQSFQHSASRTPDKTSPIVHGLAAADVEFPERAIGCAGTCAKPDLEATVRIFLVTEDVSITALATLGHAHTRGPLKCGPHLHKVRDDNSFLEAT